MLRTHIALLRGINVGKAKRIAMADLRSVAEGLGYTNVRTLLNSGNLVFDVPSTSRAAPGPRLQQAIEAELGVRCRVTVLKSAELAADASAHPLEKIAKDPSRLLVAVIADPADHRHAVALAKQDWAPEAIAVGKRVAYLWCANGVNDSPVAAALGKLVKDGVTARNWTTMAKLMAMAESKDDA